MSGDVDSRSVEAKAASPLPGQALPGEALHVRAARRGGAIGLGALLVALSAQVTVPVPLNPVPMTLQPLAVLVVGGLLGGASGAGALVLYLALGMLGLPVFAGGSSGIVRLLGPTGGYLLAFPVAAGLTGAIIQRAERIAPLRVL
ncbi:MAG: biotin transporter BioY, partial [Gemmatimonadales bacterium]